MCNCEMHAPDSPLPVARRAQVHKQAAGLTKLHFQLGFICGLSTSYRIIILSLIHVLISIRTTNFKHLISTLRRTRLQNVPNEQQALDRGKQRIP